MTDGLAVGLADRSDDYKIKIVSAVIIIMFFTFLQLLKYITDSIYMHFMFYAPVTTSIVKTSKETIYHIR